VFHSKGFLLVESGLVDDAQFYTVDQVGGVSTPAEVWPTATTRRVNGLPTANPIREVFVDSPQWLYGYWVPAGTTERQLGTLIALLTHQYGQLAFDADPTFAEQEGAGDLIKQDALWPLIEPLWREWEHEDGPE